MRKISILYAIGCLTFLSARAQTDSAHVKGIFDRIQSEIANFKPDTSAAPNDKVTKKIMEVRKLRGGFNINEAVMYKIEEAVGKKEMTPAEADILKERFRNGDAGRWLNNATIWIYRNTFTYSELKHLAKFYRSPAGQKFASTLPVVMVKTVMTADQISLWLKATN